MAIAIKPGGGLTPANMGESLRRKPDIKGSIFQVIMLFSLSISIGVLVVLFYTVIGDAWPVLSTRLGDFVTGTLAPDAGRAGISQGLKGTFYLCLIVAIVAFPLGIAAAIYLEEYAPKTRLSSFIEVNIRNLAGVPSVVYGILGLAIFVNGWGISSITGGRSPMAGGLTLAALVLPVVIIPPRRPFTAVPSALREAGFGVGATKWEVIKDHILPYAAPAFSPARCSALPGRPVKQRHCCSLARSPVSFPIRRAGSTFARYKTSLRRCLRLSPRGPSNPRKASGWRMPPPPSWFWWRL